MRRTPTQQHQMNNEEESSFNDSLSGFQTKKTLQRTPVNTVINTTNEDSVIINSNNR